MNDPMMASQFAPRAGGPPFIPGADLSHDPNQPTKKDQMRMAALQVVAQLVAAGKVELSSERAGDQLVKHSEAVLKFLIG